MINDENKSGQCEWISTELLENENLRIEKEIPESPSSLVEKFMRWQIDSNEIDFVVVDPQNDNLFSKITKRERLNSPQVIMDMKDVESYLHYLIEKALEGFKLLIATNTNADQVKHFFKEIGYAEVGNANLFSSENHDLVKAAWNKEELERSITVAIRLGAKLICCFSHDADPIYLLSRKSRV